MSNDPSFDAARPVGGVPIQYSVRRFSTVDRQHYENYIFDWIYERRAAIKDVRENGKYAEQGKLDRLSLEMIRRWRVLAVGHSPVAWMQRAVTFTSQLLDYRSRRFGKRVLEFDSSEENELNCGLANLEANEPVYQNLSPVEYKQALTATVFESEWQRYLGRLLVMPPGGPAPANEAFPSCYSVPDAEAKRMIAELAHCRPVGAYFENCNIDRWAEVGGRETCLKPLLCPHCHSRSASRLVERVLQGPWTLDRQCNRQLVFVRVTVKTEQLGVSSSERSDDIRRYDFYNRLRTSLPYYTEAEGDERMIRNIECNQDMSHTLTPSEVAAAANILNNLRDRCQQSGVNGGICFHSIGPSHRIFLHELCVVGEIFDDVASQFGDAFGINAPQPTINGFPIECYVFPTQHQNAVRLAVAGSSWNFNLNLSGVALNELSSTRCFNREMEPVGLRGALAWQPLYLLSSISYWSRYGTLKAIAFKSYRPFGTWKEHLGPDRNHKSAVQTRHRQENVVKISNGRDLVLRVRHCIAQSGLRQSNISNCAGVSKGAVSRFLNDGHGSPELCEKLKVAVTELEREYEASSGKLDARFSSAKGVLQWLKAIQRSQRWLALHLDCQPSQVSRILSGKIRWTRDFASRVQNLAQSLDGSH